jgi:phage terminase small subunit
MTPKQERFVQEYTLDSNATQAAIRAGYSAKTAMEQGYQLLQKPSVKAAIQDMQAEHRERTKVTVESLTEKLRAAYDVAQKNGQPASMVQAAMGLAKLHGYLVDKVEQTTKEADNMTPAELTAELARVQAELDAIENPPATDVGVPDKPTEH